MLPVLFKIGNFELRSFGLMIVIGIILGVFWAKRRADRVGIDPEQITSAAFWMVIAGVLGARVMFILQEPKLYIENPALLLSKFEGLTSYGGLIFGVAALIYWVKRQGWSLMKPMDIFAPPFILASAIGRIGCFLNGCCYGAPTSSHLGVHVHDLPGRYLPAQLFEAAILFAFVIFVSAYLQRFNLRSGMVTGYSLMAFATARFISEIYRGGTSSTYVLEKVPITHAQLVAIAILLVGVRLLTWNGRIRLSPEPRRQ